LHELLVAIVVAVSIGACADSKVELVPVPNPEASAFEPSVKKKLAEARANLDRIVAAQPSNQELGNAYGELAMTYHAQDLLKAAEAAYENARKLAPREIRWPYLEGHLYNDSARQPEAIRAFEAALAIDGANLPVLVSLGQVYLQHGDLDQAQRMFEKALANKDGRAAAEAGLGKVAMAKRDYKEAIKHFEEALKLWPSATQLRQPLAVAYQGVGNRAKAEENIARYDISGVEPMVADAAADALASKVVASRVLMRRGQRDAKAGRFDLAEVAFRATVAADPTNAEALANLGISLANLGRTDEAQRALTESLKMDNTSAVAHLSLGVILDRQGMDQAASEQYEAALKVDPDNTQAAVYLADLKMRLGLPGHAAELYRRALAQSPNATRMQISLAMAYIKGKRFADARKALEAVVAAQANNVEATNALARILATAPDASVRDGARALQLAKTLFQTTHNPEIGQTYAMALAETGEFTQAATLQNETMIVYERMKAPADKAFLTRNLERYRQQQPTREGWGPNDPALEPRSPAAALVKPKPAS
jgi:tetratricopeptide (TPR) repeat protein